MYDVERETGVEPATFSLARRRSTTELLPPTSRQGGTSAGEPAIGVTTIYWTDRTAKNANAFFAEKEASDVSRSKCLKLVLGACVG